MTRLLFVDQTAELGGAELVLLDVARHFSRRADVLLFEDGPLRIRLEQHGVRVLLANGGGRLAQARRHGGMRQIVAAVPALAGLVGRVTRLGRGYDVLYANSQKAAVVTLLAGAVARRPVLWHLHDILTEAHFAAPQRRAVVTLANRLAARVIANSRAARDAFVACGGDARRVAVVPNGIDPAAFDALPESGWRSLRARLGLSGAQLVGCFGRLAAWKGQHTLIAALARLPDVHALIVGDALFGEQDYKAGLLAQAGRLGVAPRVHWLGFRDDVPALMRSVDVVLHTSAAPEPFGRVIVEAMLAARPLLATRGGGTAELLGDDAPELVPPDDPEALARAIAGVFATPAETLAARVATLDTRARTLFSRAGMLAALERELALVGAASLQADVAEAA